MKIVTNVLITIKINMNIIAPIWTNNKQGNHFYDIVWWMKNENNKRFDKTNYWSKNSEYLLYVNFQSIITLTILIKDIFNTKETV